MAFADNLTWRWKIKYRSAQLEHSFQLRFPSTDTGPDVGRANNITNAFNAIRTLLPVDFQFQGSEVALPGADIFLPSLAITTPPLIATDGWDETDPSLIDLATAELSIPFKASNGTIASYTDFSVFGIQLRTLMQVSGNPFRVTIASDSRLVSFLGFITSMPIAARSGWAATPFSYANMNYNSVQEARVRKG